MNSREMVKCVFCHCHFDESIMNLRPEGMTCDYCVEEIDMGIRTEPECERCLEPLSKCVCGQLEGLRR